MWISTRGRYALRVMVDLAENNNGEYIPLKDIAKRQEISEKYLESIMVTMSKAGIIKVSACPNGYYGRAYFKSYGKIFGTRILFRDAAQPV